MIVFVTVATGQIGGGLVPQLLRAADGVVCAMRDARKLASRPLVPHTYVRIVQVGAADCEGLSESTKGCDAAF